MLLYILKSFAGYFTFILGFPGGSNGKESASNAGDLGAIPVRPRVNPWVRKIHWRREWQPSPIFLLGEFRWTEEPGGLQSRESQKSDRPERLTLSLYPHSHYFIAFFSWG